jgi:hypothetical protein
VRKLLIAGLTALALAVPGTALAKAGELPPGAVAVTEGETTTVACPSGEVISSAGTATYYTKGGKVVATVSGVSTGSAATFGPAPKKADYLVASGVACVPFQIIHEETRFLTRSYNFVCPSGYVVTEAVILDQTPEDVVVDITNSGSFVTFWPRNLGGPGPLGVTIHYRVVCQYSL